MLTDKTSVSYISYLWDSFFLFQLFFLLFLPVSPGFSPLLTVFPCLRGMIATFHSLMPRSALLSLFSSSLFPSRGACLPLFTLSCPARLCFPSFPLHFSLPAGHDCLFSHSHAPLRSVFPLFLFTFPCPRGIDCLFSLSHAPLRSAFPLFPFTFPCPRGMIAPFHSPMPRSALFSQIASSVILVRNSAPLYNTCIIWVIKPFGKSPC